MRSKAFRGATEIALTVPSALTARPCCIRWPCLRGLLDSLSRHLTTLYHPHQAPTSQPYLFERTHSYFQRPYSGQSSSSITDTIRSVQMEHIASSYLAQVTARTSQGSHLDMEPAAYTTSGGQEKASAAASTACLSQNQYGFATCPTAMSFSVASPHSRVMGTLNLHLLDCEVNTPIAHLSASPEIVTRISQPAAPVDGETLVTCCQCGSGPRVLAVSPLCTNCEHGQCWDCGVDE